MKRIGRPGEPCIIDGVSYPSQTAAAEAQGVTPSAICKRLRRSGTSATSAPRPCKWRGRDYPSIGAASRATGVPRTTLHRRLKEPRP